MWLIIIASAAVVAVILAVVIIEYTHVDIRGKYVCITGCDTGFGNLLARSLDKHRGCHVVAACLTEEGMTKLKSVTSTRLTAIQLNVKSSESIRKARDQIQDIIPTGKGLWGLVNNAGIICPMGPFHWLTRDDLTNVLNVNLLGAIEVTNMLYPLLRTAKGRVVNVSSAVALFPTAGTIYSVSKAGIEAFSDNIRCTMKASGVSVHIIEPGAFQGTFSDVDAMKRRMDTVWERLPQSEKDDIGGDITLEAMKLVISDALRMSSPNLTTVTNAMEHALSARFPWRRYLPGLDAKLFYKPMSLLPAFITDNVYSLMFTKIIENKKKLAMEERKKHKTI